MGARGAGFRIGGATMLIGGVLAALGVGCGADPRPPAGPEDLPVAAPSPAAAAGDGGSVAPQPTGNVRGIVAQVGAELANDTGFLNDANPASGMIVFPSTVLGPVMAGGSGIFGTREVTTDSAGAPALTMQFGEDGHDVHVVPPLADPYAAPQAIDVAALRIGARAACQGGLPSVETSSQLSGVVVAGVALAIAPDEQAEVMLPGVGRVLFNEVIVTSEGAFRRRFAVNALHVIPADDAVTDEIIVGHGEGFVFCQ